LACHTSALDVILLLNRTQEKELLGMLNLDAIRTIAVCIFCLYALAENQIVKHLLDKPFFFKFMRIFWALMFATLLFFSCTGLFPILDYARKLFETHELNISDLWNLIPHLSVIVLGLLCWRRFWYHFRNDEDVVLSGWYIKRHFDLNKRREFEESYRCLQRASEIKPDSLPVWCLLASFAQLFLKQPEQADQYLAKARKILDSKPTENPKEIAAVEFYFGHISQYRGDHKTAIEHMKKAYPTRYRKETFEEALELAKEENSSAGKQSE
jgi:tetratricopeptide (TPR) repeat protein